MLNKGRPSLTLIVPQQDYLTEFLSESGTFREGDLWVNKDGIRIVSDTDDNSPGPLIKPSNNQISLADLTTIKQIGEGSSGIVKLVQHNDTKQFFALKIIQMNIEESARKQIAKELKINQSNSLECPRIVSCYQCSYQNGSFSILLEYMDGGSLLDFLEKVRTIPEEHLAAICKQVVEGLYFLHHGKHFIHRDLKPSNLLINHLGEVKIADFGVSAIVASTSAQVLDSRKGSYHYMAPERFNTATYNSKSDIWSFGLVALECATGKFPYHLPDEDPGSANYYSVMLEITEQPPPRASDEFSNEFCGFISACLQKDPKNRPSAEELMNHPFLSMYDDLDTNLPLYFTNAGSSVTSLLGHL